MQNKSRRIIMNTRICLEKYDKIGGVTEMYLLNMKGGCKHVNK